LSGRNSNRPKNGHRNRKNGLHSSTLSGARNAHKASFRQVGNRGRQTSLKWFSLGAANGPVPTERWGQENEFLRMGALLADWAGFLDYALYAEALTYFLEGLVSDIQHRLTSATT
jgi:hypothetical protein